MDSVAMKKAQQILSTFTDDELHEFISKDVVKGESEILMINAKKVWEKSLCDFIGKLNNCVFVYHRSDGDDEFQVLTGTTEGVTEIVTP